MQIPQQPSQILQSNPSYEQKQGRIQQNGQRNLALDKKIALFIGPPGAGKTHLIQKLAGIPKQDKHAIEWKIYDCMHQNNEYQLRDTVGIRIENQCNNIQELQQFKQDFYWELNKKLFNRIFIICKYERIARMKELLAQCLIPIRKYIFMITLIVTHWDLSQDKEKDEQIIRNELLSFFRMDQLILSPRLNENLTKVIYNSLNENAIEFDLLDTSFDIIPQEDPEVVSQLNKISITTSQITQNYIQYLNQPYQAQNGNYQVEGKSQIRNERESILPNQSNLNSSVQQKAQKQAEEDMRLVKQYAKEVPKINYEKNIATWYNIKFQSIGFNKKFATLLKSQTCTSAQNQEKEISEQMFESFLPIIKNQTISALYVNQPNNEIYLKLDQNKHYLNTLLVLQEILIYNQLYSKLRLFLIFQSPLENNTQNPPVINYIRFESMVRLLDIIMQNQSLQLSIKINQDETQKFVNHQQVKDQQQCDNKQSIYKYQQISQIVQQYINQIKIIDSQQTYLWEPKEFFTFGFNLRLEFMLYGKRTTNLENFEQPKMELKSLKEQFQNILVTIIKGLCVSEIHKQLQFVYLVLTHKKEHQNEIYNLMVIKCLLHKYQQSEIIIIFEQLVQVGKYPRSVNYLRMIDKEQLISIIESNLPQYQLQNTESMIIATKSNLIDQINHQISQIQRKQIKSDRLFFTEQSGIINYGWKYSDNENLISQSSKNAKMHKADYCHEVSDVIDFFIPVLRNKRILYINENNEMKEIFYYLIEDTNEVEKLTLGVLNRFIETCPSNYTQILILIGNNKFKLSYNFIRIIDVVRFKDILQKEFLKQ